MVKGKLQVKKRKWIMLKIGATKRRWVRKGILKGEKPRLMGVNLGFTWWRRGKCGWEKPKEEDNSSNLKKNRNTHKFFFSILAFDSYHPPILSWIQRMLTAAQRGKERNVRISFVVLSSSPIVIGFGREPNLGIKNFIKNDKTLFLYSTFFLGTVDLYFNPSQVPITMKFIHVCQS